MQNPFAGKTIFRNHLIMIALILVLIVLIIFAIFYLRGETPAVSIPNPVVAEKVPTYEYSIYGEGNAALTKPMAIAVSGGKVFVSDTGNSRIQVYDTQGNFQYIIGGPEEEKGALEFPYGIDLMADGTILVADMYTGNLVKFSQNGEFLGYLELEIELTSPTQLVIKNGYIYVADVDLCQVLVFSEEGKFSRRFGEPGSDLNQLKYPNGLFVDDKDDIYVSDTGNDRISKFNGTGEFLEVFYPSEQANSLLSSPRNISISPSGNILVVSKMTNEVISFNPNGEPSYSIGDGMSLTLPNGIFVYERMVFITDLNGFHVLSY